MTQRNKMRRGVLLRLYLAATHLFPLIARPMLRARLARGKEHPSRWDEKLGQSFAARPDGALVWLHAVGLGEVLSLRGLITQMAQQRPDLSFLVTSTTRTSAEVFARNLPPRTIHQFLPIDAPPYRRRFLDHFKPDLCVWVEQDIWPGFVSDAAARSIPQAIVGARMNPKSFRSHQKARSLYRDIYQQMRVVTAQDGATAEHLRKLGAQVSVTGSLKPAAPALRHDPEEMIAVATLLSGRMVWAVAPSHPADEAIARAAHVILRQTNPSALLIIAPRFPDRRDTFPTDMPRKSCGQAPNATDPIWLCDTFGDLGLVYRLAQAVLIGGTFDATEGHNPWEAANLNTAILHGPHTANFRDDFAQLDATQAALPVSTPDGLAQALTTADLSNLATRAAASISAATLRTQALAGDLIALLKG